MMASSADRLGSMLANVLLYCLTVQVPVFSVLGSGAIDKSAFVQVFCDFCGDVRFVVVFWIYERVCVLLNSRRGALAIYGIWILQFIRAILFVFFVVSI